MSMFFGHLAVALIAGGFFLCTAIALLSSRRSGMETRDEEVRHARSRYPANTN
ncbi:hypothetical protein Rleg2_2452 [Rhizobium leguminosarum bv. trifolii WSM2304]|uniref:Heme exporter protein D n=1 Tax=Rhizobium leguminosarum bv. trifolii (strain WSM2304) TaxID=395492 RepID=A0ABF7QP08_RHILW|nr:MULTISPECIES: hypothetical protein [Rhizobium]ACI55726.1 hypothetical protein Rleg2_2452 [Rhizobium leguminosarum bv. trifolii WSM2304]MDR9781623.1 hypothetical protein [Rhizobium redzepovicii]